MVYTKIRICTPAAFKMVPILLLAFLFSACQDQVTVSNVESPQYSTGFSSVANANGSETDRYIVILDHPKEKTDSAGQIISELARQYKFQPAFVYKHTISGFAAVLPPGRLEALKSDSRVLKVTPDVRISLYPQPQHHRPDHGRGGPPNGDGDEEEEVSNQVIPWGVEKVGGPLAESGNRAWVIDTGIDLNHADLNINTGLGKNCVERGKNTFHDGNGHGTHVGGTIAAIDNAIDVVGVSESTELVPVRVLDNSGSGFLSWIICGVDHVAANFSAGDVANMSLGGKSSATDLDDAVLSAADAGLIFAIASGNSGDNAADFTPARTGTHPNVYTVAAINQNDQFTSWSNYGDPVSFAAPGVSILSTTRNGGTEELSGTSMATPHVAGLLLLDELCSSGTITGTDGGSYQIPYRCSDSQLLAVE